MEGTNQKDKNPCCPLCESCDTVKNGPATNGAQRYKCNNCKKAFPDKRRREADEQFIKYNLLLDYYISDIVSNKKDAPPPLSARQLATTYGIYPAKASAWINELNTNLELNNVISDFFSSPAKWEVYYNNHKKSRQ